MPRRVSRVYSLDKRVNGAREAASRIEIRTYLAATPSSELNLARAYPRAINHSAGLAMDASIEISASIICKTRTKRTSGNDRCSSAASSCFRVIDLGRKVTERGMTIDWRDGETRSADGLLLCVCYVNRSLVTEPPRRSTVMPPRCHVPWMLSFPPAWGGGVTESEH